MHAIGYSQHRVDGLTVEWGRVLPAINILACSLCLTLAPAAQGAAAGGTPAVKRLLVVYENESTLFAVTEVSRGLLGRLNEPPGTGIEFYSEYLDTVRFPDPDHRRRLTAHLTAKYRNMPLDVVLAMGPGALRFVLAHRDEIAPGAPVVFGGVSERSYADISVDDDVWGVVSHFDVVRTVDLARTLQPDAKRIVVLTGSSDFDNRWQDTARNDLGARYGDLDVEYLTGASLEDFRNAVRELPSDTILLILTVFEDADGRNYVPRDAAAEIAAVSGAPSYSVYSSYVGAGVVGGYTETFEGIGQGVASLVSRILSDSAPVSRTLSSTARPVVDWRQLARWGIDDGRLPPDTQLQYYDPPVWERYRLGILAAIAVIVLQSATIIGLILTERRRRRTKAELALERLELAHLSRATQLGELSGSFAHELNQPLTSILANAEAGQRLLEADPVDLAEIRAILDDIVDDDRRAASVIAQLRQLMLKGEGEFSRLDLNSATTATLELAQSELLARHTKIDLRCEATELPVSGNLAQLQQVILNLIMNAADAMSDLHVSKRRIEIETRRRDDGGSELSVSDSGPGISPEMALEAFKPFVSTKSGGLGLGLAICRSIVLMHGGKLRFDEQNTDGARVILTLPPV